MPHEHVAVLRLPRKVLHFAGVGVHIDEHLGLPALVEQVVLESLPVLPIARFMLTEIMLPIRVAREKDLLLCSPESGYIQLQ